MGTKVQPFLTLRRRTCAAAAHSLHCILAIAALLSNAQGAPESLPGSTSGGVALLARRRAMASLSVGQGAVLGRSSLAGLPILEHQTDDHGSGRSLQIEGAVERKAGDVSWRPRPNKYLLMLCSLGRISNQVSCFKKSLRLAAILNRTLLVPPKGIIFVHHRLIDTYPLDMVVDWQRIASCLEPAYGPSTVMTFPEYFKKHNVTRVRVNKVHCAADRDSDRCLHARRLRHLVRANGRGMMFPSMDKWLTWTTPPLFDDVPLTERMLRQAYGRLPDHVLCAGELFSISYDRREKPGAFSYTRPQSCNNLWHPHKAISEFATSVIAEHLGTGFAAMHLRRGDFYLESVRSRRKWTIYSNALEYGPVTDVAREVARILKANKVNTLYLATDASQLELKLFQDILRVHAGIERVFTLRSLLNELQYKKPWAQVMTHMLSMYETDIPWALADKSICRRSDLFLGTGASSFSKDIIEMRCNEIQHTGLDNTSLLCFSGRCFPGSC